MKRKNILCVFAVVLITTVLLSNCDNFGTIRGVIGFRGEVYFQNANNIGSLSVSRSAIDVNDIELLVYRLILKDDTSGGGVWVIGGNEGGTPGWYDINAIRKANFGNQPQGRPHSCMYLTFAAIRIGETFYAPSLGIGGADPIMVVKPNAKKEDFTTDIHQGGSGFGIIAGDISSLGPGEGTTGYEKNIPFQGVKNMQDIRELIINVDTDILLNSDETLAENWWECFSFVVR